MSIALIVFRQKPDGKAARISLDDWKAVANQHDDLRMKSGPCQLINQRTGETITIETDDGDSEIHADGEWQPFLSYRRGELVTGYAPEFEDPRNPIRRKIAAVAKSLGAVIGTDCGDELLEW